MFILYCTSQTQGHSQCDTKVEEKKTGQLIKGIQQEKEECKVGLQDIKNNDKTQTQKEIKKILKRELEM